LLIWAIMLVSSQLVRTDRHVRPDLVLNIASPRVKRWMEVFNSLAGLVFCVGLTWYGWQVAATALIIDEHSATDLSFPMWIYDAALPAGGFLMSIRYIIRLAKLLISSNWKTMLARRPGDNELPATG
jgi:C4-dicarboxylate transporter DctQ subunit